MSDNDVLFIDLPAASVLAYALLDAGEGLRRDGLVLDELLTRATTMTGVVHFDPLAQLGRAQTQLDGLTRDLWDRMLALFAIRDGIAELDVLSKRAAAWEGTPQDPARLKLLAERDALLLDLVDGDEALAARVLIEMRRGSPAAAAIASVHREMLDAEHRRQRAAMIRAQLDITEAEASQLIERVDAHLAALLDAGFGEDDAIAAVGLVEAFDLDLDSVVGRAAQLGIALPAAAAEFLIARGLGLELPEYDALLGADKYQAIFDTAGGSKADQRFSLRELEYVIEHAGKFTVGQVEAAAALLAHPELFNRLDTADENNKIFAGDRFGRLEPGDGIIADVDIKAFMLKTQLHVILGEYADEIDIANDPSGIVDGFRSQSDFRAFLADNPDLPEQVREAAGIALDAGWFDEGWWQRHKDEIAAGAALLAGGLVLFSGGTSLILLGLAAAAAAGSATVAINVASGDGLTDDLLANALSGFLIGIGVGGIASGVGAISVGAGAGNVGAIAGIVAGGSDIVSQGGVDLLLPESLEDDVNSVAEIAGLVAMPVDIAVNARTVAGDIVAQQSDDVARGLGGAFVDEAAQRALRQAEETLAVYAARDRLPIDRIADGEAAAVDSMPLAPTRG